MQRSPGNLVRVALAVLVSALAPIVVAGAEPRSDASLAARTERIDEAIKADVQRVFRADRSLDDSGIIVSSVDNGIVVLAGQVASSEDQLRALRVAASRPGVRWVFSDSTAFAATSTPFGVRLVGLNPREAAASIGDDPIDTSDDVIQRDVERALQDLHATDNADIRVLVKDGIVWLTGSVPQWEGNASRLHATRSVTGVRSIINRIGVEAR